MVRKISYKLKELSEKLEKCCQWWCIGLQGIALEVIEPLSKIIGLDILQNCGIGLALEEKIKEKKELNSEKIKTIIEKYNLKIRK